MRNFLLTMMVVPMMVTAQFQTRPITKSGSLTTIEEPISRPDSQGLAFNQMVQNGHYEMGRVLNYDSLNMSFLGNWSMGVSYSLAYSGLGNIFLIGTGGAVMVIDAANPANPQQISVIHSRSLVDCMFFDTETSRLYLGAYFSGVEIWDLTDLAVPVRLTRIPTESYPRGGIYADGNLLYVMSVADGIYIYDLTDLNNIPKIGHFSIPSSTLIWNSAKDGNLMFCAANNSCRIVDVSDPYNPNMIGVVAGGTTGVAAADNRLYQVSGGNLRIWNINNPASPQMMGQVAITGYPARITLQGDYAFIANSTYNVGGGVNIIDVTDPTNPVQVASYPGYAESVAVSNNMIYFSGGSYSAILDIAEITNPVLASEMSLPSWTHKVCVEGNLAFTGSNGFRVFDISDKAKPVQIGYHETAGDLVAVSGDLAVYIPKSMTAANPVNIMDISDPANPFKRGHYTAPVMTYDIVLKDHYAFIACWWDGFRVVNFSNPDQPTLAAHKFGWFNGAEPGVQYCFVQALDIDGNYLYLIDYEPFEDQDTKGLYIFDITDPQNPVYVNRFATLLSKGKDVSVRDGYAYVADDQGGMEVINVTDPMNPMSVGYVYLPDAATGVEADGNYAYVSNYIFGGVQTVDISFSSNPFIAGHYKPSGVFALGVTIDGSHVYVADGIAGFQIYDNLIITNIIGHETNSTSQLKIYPNPTSSEATINFATEKAFCRIEVVDITGRKIRTLFEGVLDDGEYSFTWDGSNTAGYLLPNGLYLVRVQSGSKLSIEKLMIAK